MWRAWGIFLLALSQDLGSRTTSPDHEFAFRPPAGWNRQLGMGPTLAKYVQPGDLKSPTEYLVTHLHSSNPTPIESFKKQAKDNIKEKYAGAKILEEKDLTIAGKKAFRVVFQHNDVIQLKTVIHRSNIEFYLLDAVMPLDQASKVQPVIESSVASFEIIPMPMSTEERAADARTMTVIRAAKLDPALLGEKWFTVQLGPKKVGTMRFKMIESEGMYSFETVVHNDFGEGNSDTTLVKGSFTPDGRIQKLVTEETKVNPKQKWVFAASAAMNAGQVKVARELNGIKEERSFAVEEGVLFTDIAECLRSVLVGAGRGTYLLKTLSPFSEEWNVEMIDVGGPESLEVDGRTRDCTLVQAYVGRRKNMTYYYAPDRSVIRVGGPKDVFSIRASTKDEAEKK
ncbi:MAG: hypothetical protein EHM91_08920 [Planctomycetota bacterium]|nr:MAG: hypothetical protein EHM91_08920 [Planctomycetota bacterium]